MTYILRMIDMAHPEQPDGLLIDLLYNCDDENNILVEDIKVYNIINNEVGQLVDVSPVVKLAFTAKLLQILESENI